jgi:L-asparaginase
MSTGTKPRVAVIGTGGTIASLGSGPLDLATYMDHGGIYDVDELLGAVPEVHQVADVTPIAYAALPSSSIEPRDWLALLERIHALQRERSDLDGVVVTHGTASLEETAYFLNLTLKVDIPVVLVGAQRPATALSADGPLNLVNAVRTAGSESARGKGVLVVLNDEIHAARDVTKTSTLRLQTFRSPDFGVLGHADQDTVAFYREPLRAHYPDTEFDLGGIGTLPRVDVVLSYAGADAAAIEAFVAAGARGVVAAGFGPSLDTPAQLEALQRAADGGVVVVQSARVGSGRILALRTRHVRGGITADNLVPWKARVLLMVALAHETPAGDLQRIFDTY